MEKIRFIDYLNDYLEINNITNKDFANRIGISEKHLIDILSGTSKLSSGVINNISFVTGIPIDYIYKIEANYDLERDISNYLEKNKMTPTEFLNKFNYKYLIDNNWFNFADKKDKLEIIKDILKFLRVKSPDKIYEIDEKIYFKSKNDKPELLLLWLEKCYKESLKQKVSTYCKKNIDILVDYIKSCAKKSVFNKKSLIKIFNENGIALVIKEDIPGSKIRGAFKVHKDVPAIYITLKHKRIADVYLALLHELAHCKSDFNKAKSTNLVSFDNQNKNEELSADTKAFNWMVDESYYNIISNDINYSIENEKKYPKCFVAYRFAKDGKIKYSSKEYQKYNILLD
jgi:HTH-type transcriptional regulator/antitoxin HigA